MKTIKQIQQKANLLKKRLQNKSICENFGEKEISQLDLFIGPFWDYSYEMRQQIIPIQSDFSDWCMNYTSN